MIDPEKQLLMVVRILSIHTKFLIFVQRVSAKLMKFGKTLIVDIMQITIYEYFLVKYYDVFEQQQL